MAKHRDHQALAPRKCKPPLHGLGDVIAELTKAIGIKPCAACKRRQAWLNKKIPFKKKAARS